MSKQTLEDLLRNDDSDEDVDVVHARTGDARFSVDQILKGADSGSDEDDRLDGLIAAHSKWRPPSAVVARPAGVAASIATAALTVSSGALLSGDSTNGGRHAGAVGGGATSGKRAYADDDDYEEAEVPQVACRN